EAVRIAAVDGLRRRLLRQRDDRSVLVADAGRAAQHAPLAHTGRARERDLRVRRGPPQPTPPPLRSRNANTDRIRIDQHHHTSGRLSPETRLHQSRGTPGCPEKRGKLTAWFLELLQEHGMDAVECGEARGGRGFLTAPRTTAEAGPALGYSVGPRWADERA